MNLIPNTINHPGIETFELYLTANAAEESDPDPDLTFWGEPRSIKLLLTSPLGLVRDHIRINPPDDEYGGYLIYWGNNVIATLFASAELPAEVLG